jgi:hypothetical protein
MVLLYKDQSVQAGNGFKNIFLDQPLKKLVSQPPYNPVRH